MPRRLLQKIPYFEALTSTRWAQDGDGYDLPSWPEFHSMEVVMELIKFSNSKVEEYSFPEDHRRAFSLLRLADLVGVDSFVTLMAEKLDVPVARITNTNSIRDVRRCIRDRYRISKHHGGRVPGLCGKCRQPLAACPPAKTIVETTLCCHRQVHSKCIVMDSHSCAVCEQSFTILLCIVCRKPVTHPGRPVESYCLAKANQLPCCGADVHKQCRAGMSAGRCPCCQMPLTQGEEGFDEMATAADYIFMRREYRLNDVRRWKNIVDYKNPAGKIDWSRH